MNILILNGSPKKSGNTAKVLQQITEAADQSHHIEIVHAYDLSVKPCLGCHRCRPDRECVLEQDDAHIFGRKIKNADILIIGSPTYWGNMSGALKNLLDRSVTVFEIMPEGRMSSPRHKGKKAVIVTTSGAPWPFNQLNSQAKGCIRSIKTILKKGGYQIKGTINFGGAKFNSELPPKVIKRAREIGSIL